VQLTNLFAWLQANGDLLGWLGALSLVTFVTSLALLPALVVRIPPDYFSHRHREHDYAHDRHPLVHHLIVLAKNLLGVLLVLAGMAMLVLPGQGILTILIGLMLTDFPGKYDLERALVARPSVLKSMNWIRAKARQPPLEPPRDEGD
jgi:hypothetical protein